MEEAKHKTSPRSQHRTVLRIGYVPLADCAPIVMAQELGLYSKYGLEVSLSRELGWAAVRDKIACGELDAAHAVVGLPFAMTLGIRTTRCECVTGLVLNLQGNAITLSNELWRDGVRDAESLRRAVWRMRGARKLTFAVVSSVSSHHFLLRRWLKSAGIDPERDIRFVVIPPSQMPTSLRAANIDGFCAGEPWNSLAVAARVGWIVALSSDLAPRHPEKVLIARRSFASTRAEEHELLIAALLESCAHCHAPENRDHVMAVLAKPSCLDRAAVRLRPGFTGCFDAGHGRELKVDDFLIFSGGDANEPTADKAAWTLNELRSSGILHHTAADNAHLIRAVFRVDIHDRARRLPDASQFEPNVENEKHEILPCH